MGLGLLAAGAAKGSSAETDCSAGASAKGSYDINKNEEKYLNFLSFFTLLNYI